MGSHDALPDAILELVFLGLDTAVSLHRAALACKRWRRIIASQTFRALHKAPPLFAGSYYNQMIISVRPHFDPSPSTGVDRRHFSLGFHPGGNHCKWLIKDSCGSLLHLVRRDGRASRNDLIVCEPLTRRHEVLPSPPLAPAATYSSTKAVLLVDDVDSEGGGDGAIGMSNFKVLWLVHNGNNLHDSLHANLFTSGGGSTWQVSSIDGQPELNFIGIAAGRRYWHDGGKKVVTLNQSTLEFSSFVLPDDDDWNSLSNAFGVSLTVGRDGEARIAVGCGNEIEGSNNMKIYARVQDSSASGEKWELEKTVQLSAAMLGLSRLERFFFSRNWPVEAGKVKIRVPSPAPGWHICRRFCLDMDTMEVERLGEQDDDYVPGHSKAYPIEFPWPSLLRAWCTHDNDEA